MLFITLKDGKKYLIQLNQLEKFTNTFYNINFSAEYVPVWVPQETEVGTNKKQDFSGPIPLSQSS